MTTINFTDWLPWERRGEIEPVPGVYMIRKGEEVIYVGETKGKKGLRGRLGQFHRASQNGVSKHAGGRTYHRKFGPNVDDLFVQYHIPATAFDDKKILRAYILYVERRTIWEFIEKFGRLPACNSE